jgi:hypothetical protein
MEGDGFWLLGQVVVVGGGVRFRLVGAGLGVSTSTAGDFQYQPPRVPYYKKI